jgi:hypothetical protein
METPVGSTPNNTATRTEGTASSARPVAISATATGVSTFFIWRP